MFADDNTVKSSFTPSNPSASQDALNLTDCLVPVKLPERAWITILIEKDNKTGTSQVGAIS